MDEKLFDSWLDGFVGAAEQAGYDEAGTSNLLKISSRMGIQQKHPEKFAEGYASIKQAGSILNFKTILAALTGAGLLHAGKEGLRAGRQYYGIMPGDPSRWDVGDIQGQNQKVTQFRNAMRGLNLGGGDSYGLSGFQQPVPLYPPMYPSVYSGYPRSV